MTGKLKSYKVFYRRHRGTYEAVQMIAGAAVLLWSWRRWRGTKTLPPSGDALMQVFSMWACWQLLFGPGTEQLTYGLIAPSTSWAVVESFSQKRGRCLAATAWAISSFLPSGDVEKAVCSIVPAGRALLPLSILLMVVWLTTRGKTAEISQGGPAAPREVYSIWH
jgi:hypothetical protein